MARYDLHYTDRGEHLRRRKEIYEEKYPDTKKGQYGHKGTTTIEKSENEIISFSEDTASKFNISESTVQQEIQIAERLTPEVKMPVTGIQDAMTMIVTGMRYTLRK